MRFGLCPPAGSLGWLVHREDGTWPIFTAAHDTYEEARPTLVRLALDNEISAVILVVTERGEVVREPVGR